jgi:hypothetical protein
LSAGGAGGVGAQPSEPSIAVRHEPSTDAPSSVSVHASAAALPLHAVTCAAVGAHVRVPDDDVAAEIASVNDCPAVSELPVPVPVLPPDVAHAASASVASTGQAT